LDTTKCDKCPGEVIRNQLSDNSKEKGRRACLEEEKRNRRDAELEKTRREGRKARRHERKERLGGK
jgi:hypothetical protein